MTEEELKPLTKTDLATLAEYFKKWNGTRAWMETHPKSSYNSARASAAEWLAKPNIKAAIQDKLDELQMSADEAVKRVSDIARGDVGMFFKIVDEWMFNPLPEYEILDEREVVDDTKDPPEKRISYRVRHAVLDMDRILDPQYSWMIKSFSNSRKFGLKIETHNQHDALKDILKLHGRFTDRVDLTSGGEPLTIVIKKASDGTNGNDK